MKKFLSFLLAITMLASLFTVSAFAAEGDMSISLVAAGEVKPGGVVTMNLVIADNPGVIVVKASVEYDTTKLTCVSYEHNDAATGLSLDATLSQTPTVGSFTEGKVNIVAGSDMATTDVSFNGNLGTVTFRAADTVTAGETIPVTLTLNAVVNAEGNDVTCDNVSNGITVADVWTATNHAVVADTHVDLGTDETGAIAALPTQVEVWSDETGTKKETRDVATWAPVATYDGNVATTYAFEGTIATNDDLLATIPAEFRVAANVVVDKLEASIPAQEKTFQAASGLTSTNLITVLPTTYEVTAGGFTEKVDIAWVVVEEKTLTGAVGEYLEFTGEVTSDYFEIVDVAGTVTLVDSMNYRDVVATNGDFKYKSLQAAVDAAAAADDTLVIAND